MALKLTDKTSNAIVLTNDGADEDVSDPPFAACKTVADFELGNTDYMYVADNAPLSITGDISIEFWLKMESLPSAAGTNFALVAKWNTTTAASYIAYVNTANDKLYFGFTSTGSADQITQAATQAALATGEWHHWAITADVSAGQTGIIFYKDGSAVADDDLANGSTAIHDNNSSFALGASFSSGNPQSYLDGKLGDVRVWNDIRSSGEVSANYNVLLTGAEANLVANWDFIGPIAVPGSYAYFM